MERSLRLRDRDGCSITAILTRACALALREVPRANGAYRDGRFELYSRVNVGVVMQTDDAYLIPTVFDADQKSLAALTDEIETLRIRAQDRVLTSPALSGATFTLSNVGADGVARSTLVTSPPQAAALAAGAIQEAPVVRDGVVVAGQRMTVTLACDHRILYGREAARFVSAIASALEGGGQ
jgi:pyruvate dehydrogenase E2 component (dihydrolipoamide acetyltransferase)